MNETTVESISEASASLAALRALPDDELVNRVRAGEQRAFEPIMRRYNRRLFRAARGIVGSDAEAEEIVQEAYIRAYLHLDDFRGPKGFGAWLTRIAVNEALMRRRGLRSAPTAAWEQYEDDTLYGGPMSRDEREVPRPDEASANRQLADALEQCIDRLPEAFRITFVLREVEQMTVAETAASLGISPLTVKTRVHRARRLLRRSLTREFRQATADAYPFGGARCDRTVAAVFRRLSGAVADDDRPH